MNNLKKYLFVLILLVFLIPGILQRFPVVTSSPLFGAFAVAEIPSFDWSSWFSGDFQSKFDKGIEQNIGLRNSFIRLHNQINYSLFNLASAKSVAVCKDGFLIEDGYINSALGNDGVNEGAIQLKIERAKFVQQELEKRGKHLLILFVPGKASFYPEYIPSHYHPENKKTTNYDVYSKLLPKSGLHYIDLKGYFLKMKDTSPYPLYPKQGTHWSNYGATLAMDSIINYIKYDFKINVPTMSIKEIETPDTLRDTDYDIGTGMNLMFKIPHSQMGYAKINFESDSGKTRPNVLTIGDSYFWTMLGLGLNEHVFKNNAFWYYNKIAYVAPYSERPVSDFNFREEVEKQDIIILLQTEAYYNNVGMGFIESAYSMYKN
ncbi:sugar O-acetyltransferase [soil metagenome]